MSLRADLSATFGQTLIFFTDESVSGVDFSKHRWTNVVRARLGLGVEVTL